MNTFIKDENVDIIAADIDANGYYININNRPTIIINKKLNGLQERLTVAEEYAHYKVGAIPTLPLATDYYNKLIRSKNEFKAFKWMQRNLIPLNIEKLKYGNIWDIADKFDVSPEFVYEVLKYRKESQNGSQNKFWREKIGNRGINKYYRITKTIGHRQDGTPIKKEFYGESKKEAENKAEIYIGNINNGLNIGFDKLTVCDLFHYWLFEVIQYASNRKHSTFERYETTYRLYIKDSPIGIKTIYDINSHIIQNYYNDLYKKGKSTSTIGELNKELKAFMNWAIKNDYLLKNPCNNIVIPGNADEDFTSDEDEYIDYFSFDEINAFQSNYKEDNTKYICMLALGMGLRQGEILGLQKSKIDIQNQEIIINRTLSKKKIFKDDNHIRTDLILTTPKTKSSIRKLHIPNNLIIPLSNCLKEVENKYNKNGLEFKDDSLIFTTNTCKPIDSTDFRRAWKRLLNRSGVEYKRFHCLRHTFASILFSQGASLKAVQKILGHSNLATTERIYVHIMPEDKINTIDKINIVFQNWVGKKSGNSKNKRKFKLSKPLVFYVLELPAGIEPTTSSLPWMRSTYWAMEAICIIISLILSKSIAKYSLCLRVYFNIYNFLREM